MRLRFWIYVLFFLNAVCFAQAPESPSIEKKKVDSLYAVLKNIPEHGTKQNDTIQLNAIYELIRKVPDDTAQYYFNVAIKKCEAYSQIVKNADQKEGRELQEAINKDPFLNYYLRYYSKLLRYAGGHEISGENKLNYFLRALKISEKINYKLGVASSHLSICFVYYQQGVYIKAIDNLLIAQNIYRQIGNNKLLADSYRMLGDIYFEQKDFKNALHNFSIALDISKKLHYIFELGVNYERIGNCYIELKDYPKAIENHFASLKVSEKLDDIKGVGDSYSDIAAIYLGMNDYPKSLSNYVDALKMYKLFGNFEFIANGYKDVGIINQRFHKSTLALSYLDSALVIYQKEKMDFMIASTFSLKSDIYLEIRDLESATNMIEKEIKVCRNNNFLDLLKDAYKKMALVNADRNDYKSAYYYHVLYAQIKDSFINSGDETTESITALQAKFDKEKTEQEKLLHEALLAQKEAKLEQEKTQRYALYGGLILVVAFSIFVFNRFRLSQKQKATIEQQKQLVDDAYKHLAEKNKEVLDSITYARRIQRALVTSELYIEKQLNRLIKDDNKTS